MTPEGDPLDHTLVHRLLPDYIERVREAERKLSDLDARIAEAEQSDDEDSEEDDDSAIGPGRVEGAEEGGAGGEEGAAEAEESARRTTGPGARKGHEGRVPGACSTNVSRGADCGDRPLRERNRRALVAALENWWDKYQLTLHQIESESRVRSRASLRTTWRRSVTFSRAT